MKRRLLSFLLLALVLGTIIFSGCREAQCSPPPEESESTTGWEPDRERPWNFTPTIGERNLEDYDIEMTLEAETYPSTVDEIRVQVVNRTGKTSVLGAAGLFVEKYDTHAFWTYGLEATAGWVRLPYYTGYFMYQKGGTAKDNITFIFDPEYLQENCELTPGRYRFVVFLGDGPHYAYFEITE